MDAATSDTSTLGSRRRLLAGTLIVLLFFCAFISLYKEIEYIDQNSGKVKYSQEIGSIILAARVVDTEFSLFVAERGEFKPALWRPASSHSIFTPISPHCQFHGIAHTLKTFMIFCDLQHISHDEKEKLALRILGLLRAGRVYEIRRFMIELEEGTAAGNQR